MSENYLPDVASTYPPSDFWDVQIFACRFYETTIPKRITSNRSERNGNLGPIFLPSSSKLLLLTG